jgi:hypothetical protein
MVQNQLLHHYTTLETLELILKNKTIRFNRLDHVDDVGESFKYGKYDLSFFLFVSCWTFSDEENIPLWQIYSKGMTGVKLSLPLDPFEYMTLKPNPLWGGTAKGEISSIFSIEEIFTDEYMVNMSILNKNNFIKIIEYSSEEELQIIRKKAVNYIIDSTGRSFLTVAGPTLLAGYKSKEWSFQKEIRYIIMIYPTPQIPSSGIGDLSYVNELPRYVIKFLEEGRQIKINYFDIKLDQNSLDHLIVTLGPHTPESDKLIVEKLLQKYTKYGEIKESALTNLIRKGKIY